jgi:hypothetical protein
LASSSEESET